MASWLAASRCSASSRRAKSAASDASAASARRSASRRAARSLSSSAACHSSREAHSLCNTSAGYLHSLALKMPSAYSLLSLGSHIFRSATFACRGHNSCQIWLPSCIPSKNRWPALPQREQELLPLMKVVAPPKKRVQKILSSAKSHHQQSTISFV